MDPETAHRLAIAGLALLRYSRVRRLRAHLIGGREQPVPFLGRGLPHPIGLAAGFDKGACAVTGLFGLGFAFVEVGSVTLLPERGHPRPRVWRLPEHQAVVNRMGLPNPGLAVVARRLRRLKYRPGLVGANLAGARELPADPAAIAALYRVCVEELAPWVDYFTLNISCPNATAVPAYWTHAVLPAVMATVRAQPAVRPVFVKIGPLLTAVELDVLAAGALAAGVTGFVATNTLPTQQGGFSGLPLRQLSTQTIERLSRWAGGKVPIIGVGGIATGADVREKRDAGATVVQLYTGMVYRGPWIVRDLLNELKGER